MTGEQLPEGWPLGTMMRAGASSAEPTGTSSPRPQVCGHWLSFHVVPASDHCRAVTGILFLLKLHLSLTPPISWLPPPRYHFTTYLSLYSTDTPHLYSILFRVCVWVGGWVVYIVHVISSYTPPLRIYPDFPGLGEIKKKKLKKKKNRECFLFIFFSPCHNKTSFLLLFCLMLLWSGNAGKKGMAKLNILWPYLATSSLEYNAPQGQKLAWFCCGLFRVWSTVWHVNEISIELMNDIPVITLLVPFSGS